jgi:hypothetical protein
LRSDLLPCKTQAVSLLLPAPLEGMGAVVKDNCKGIKRG